MATASTTLTVAGQASKALRVSSHGELFTVTLTPTALTATLLVEKSSRSVDGYKEIARFTFTASSDVQSGTFVNDYAGAGFYRVRALALTADDGEVTVVIADATADSLFTFADPGTGKTVFEVKQDGAVLTGALTVSGGIIQTGVQMIIPATIGFAGEGAGWVLVDAADVEESAARLPASVTAGTWIVPVTGLNVGDTVTAFSLVGQIESGGNIATLDASLRKHTAVAADITDASLGAITQISVTADATVSASKTLTTPEVMAANETLYVLITGTTAAATDIALMGITVTKTTAV
jgi:hypothetical protein